VHNENEVDDDPISGRSSFKKKFKLSRQNSAFAQMDNFIKKGRGRISFMIHNFLDVPDSSAAAAWYGALTNVLTVAAVLTTVAQTTEPPLIGGSGAVILEVSFESYFLLELILRFLTIPDRGHYFRHVHTYIDVAAVLPFFFRVVINFNWSREGDEDHLERQLLLTIVPILRMLKLLRRFQKFLLLQTAFADVAEALPVLLYTLATIALSFSGVIYLVEPRSNIGSLPEAMWLTIVTMMTVGYGDKVPESGVGSCVVSVLIICSALYMAMPLGIVGAAFTNVWKKRDAILLVKRTRDQMQQRGYTAIDIPCLFKIFDSDGDGFLSRSEFKKMIESMSISLPPDRVLALFDTFDSDGGGYIDALEFIRQVFPKAFQDIYGFDPNEEDPEIPRSPARENLS
jgi:hypothetical protein